MDSKKYPNIDPITQEIIDKKFLKDIDKFSNSILLKNIYNIYTSYLENFDSDDKKYFNRELIISGIVEAAYYLTYLFKDDEIEITVKDCHSGNFNTVFICEMCNKTYALRILFNDELNSNKQASLLKKLMKDKDYEKYFNKPLLINKDFESIKKKHNINTYWMLLPYLTEFEFTEENLTKFLNTSFNCLNVLHRNKMFFRDWNISNIMLTNDKMILSDIDFSDEPDKTPCVFNPSAVRKFLKSLSLKGNDLEFAVDNVIAFICFIVYENYQKTEWETVLYDIDCYENDDYLSNDLKKLIKDLLKNNCLINSLKFKSYVQKHIDEINKLDI